MRQLKIAASTTDRSPVIDRYFSDISSYPTLTVDQEIAITTMIAEGDESLVEYAGKKMKPRDILINANLRFVVSVAKKYQWSGTALIDLINEGNFGLMKAADRFDHTRGFKFISFAVWWIRQSIMQYLATDASTIRMPLNKISFQNHMKKAEEVLMQELGRVPGLEEIADEMERINTTNIKSLNIPKVLNEMALSPTKKISPVRKFDDGDEVDVIESMASTSKQSNPFELAIHSDRAKEIEMITGCLSFREKQIVLLKYGIGISEPQTLEEIGQRIDLTRERVRQILVNATRKMKHRHRRNSHLLDIK